MRFALALALAFLTFPTAAGEPVAVSGDDPCAALATVNATRVGPFLNATSDGRVQAHATMRLEAAGYWMYAHAEWPYC